MQNRKVSEILAQRLRVCPGVVKWYSSTVAERAADKVFLHFYDGNRSITEQYEMAIKYAESTGN